MKNTTLPFFLFFSLLHQTLSAQITPACPIPPPPGAEDCQNTCVYCDLNGYVGINNGTPSSGNTVCGQIAIHNDQWFGFIAGTSSITITVLPSNCQNGDGLQTAFFDDCSAPDAIICNPGMTGNGNTPLPLQYDNFNIGQTYYLMIDGWSGDVCDYTIEVSDGLIGAPPPDTPIQPQGPTVVCPGAQVEYHIDAVAGAGYYQWNAPVGSQINGQGSFASFEAPEGTTVTVTFGNSGGNICVRAGNACNTPTIQVCLPVVNQLIPPTILPTLIVCNDDLPYVWTQEPYPTLTNAGTFNLVSSQQSYLGCDSVVKQTIVVKSPIWVNLGTIFLCQGSCFPFGDSLYCSTGTYTRVLDSYQGCDSTVTVSLDLFDPVTAAKIQSPQGQTLTCTQPTLMLQGNNSPNLAHFWKNNQGDTLSTATSILVNAPGIYFHQVVSTQGPLSCEGTQKILIKQNNTPPPVTAMGGSIDAAHPTVQLMGHSIISGVTYLWTGPNGFSSTLKKPVVSEPGFYTLTVTNPQTGCSSSITVEVIFMI